MKPDDKPKSKINYLDIFLRQIEQKANKDVAGAQFNDDKIGWQIRIAINPKRPDVLNKIYRKLAEKFYLQDGSTRYEFKVHIFNDPESVAFFAWDAFSHSLENPACSPDRQQISKEVCFYLRYDPKKKKFKQSTEEIKGFILQCWKVIQEVEEEEHVQLLGYAAPTPGDMPLPTEGNIVTPFSVTVATPDGQPENTTMPWHVRHGETHKKYRGPGVYGNPLKGVVIKPSDLKKYGIKNKTQEIINSRIHFHQNHLENFAVQFTKEIQRIEGTEDLLSLKQILHHFESCFQSCTPETIQKILKDESENIAFFQTYCPRFPDDKLTSREVPSSTHPLHTGNYRNFINSIAAFNNGNNLTPESIEVFKQLFQSVKDEILSEIEATQNELAELKRNRHPLLTEIDDQKLAELVEINPPEMQLMYRKLVHFQHEYTAFEEQKGLAGKNSKTAVSIPTSVSISPSSLEPQPAAAQSRSDVMEAPEESPAGQTKSSDSASLPAPFARALNGQDPDKLLEKFARVLHDSINKYIVRAEKYRFYQQAAERNDSIRILDQQLHDFDDGKKNSIEVLQQAIGYVKGHIDVTLAHHYKKKRTCLSRFTTPELVQAYRKALEVLPKALVISVPAIKIELKPKTAEIALSNESASPTVR